MWKGLGVVIVIIILYTLKNIKHIFLIVLLIKLLLFVLVNCFFFTDEKNAVLPLIKTIFGGYDYCKNVMKKHYNSTQDAREDK